MIESREGMLHIHVQRKRRQNEGLLERFIMDELVAADKLPDKLIYKDKLVYIDNGDGDPMGSVFRIRGKASREVDRSLDGKMVRVTGDLRLNPHTSRLGSFTRARIEVLA